MNYRHGNSLGRLTHLLLFVEQQKKRNTENGPANASSVAASKDDKLGATAEEESSCHTLDAKGLLREI